MAFLAEPAAATWSRWTAPPTAARNLAPRPDGNGAAGRRGCTAYDVVLILSAGRHDVSGCEVRLEAERARRRPQGLHRIALEFRRSRAKGLPREVVERAVRLSHEKYCSATAMLGRTAEIVTRVEVIEEP